jgi:hypothetical protein
MQLATTKLFKSGLIVMDLSSLNVDVLLYLIKSLDPVDRFNLALSGILKGFENVNKGIHLDERYCEHLTTT